MKRVAFVLLGIAALGLGSCRTADQPANDFDAMTVGEQFNWSLDQFAGALGSISDVESAQAALPALKSSDQHLSRAMSLYLDQTTETQQDIAEEAHALLPGIESSAKNATAIPGVADVIGPTVDSIMKKLDRFK